MRDTRSRTTSARRTLMRAGGVLAAVRGSGGRAILPDEQRNSRVARGDSRGVEKFFDGKVFDPANPSAYLDSLAITAIG